MSGFWEQHVVPRLVDLTCGVTGVEKLREPVCRDVHGDVIEIGFGSGLNLRHYPPTVHHVAAVEPSDLAWRLAAERVAASPVDVRREGLDGQRLDLADDSFDCAVSTFTLCTIPDLDAALAEVRRVLRPGGTLHFVEHGLAPDPAVRKWQVLLTPVQKRVGGGCHLDRPILEHIERAGFEVAQVDRFYGAWPKALGAFYLGRAKAS